MTKKILLLLVVAVFAISGAFSAQLIQIGGAAQYQMPATEAAASENILDGLTELSNYKFGADVRLNVLFLNVSALGLYQPGVADIADNTKTVPMFDTALTAGLTFGLGPIRLTAGVGPNFMFGLKDDAFVVGTDQTPVTDFMEVVKGSPLVYRADLSVNFGALGVGASYMINSATSIGDFDFSKILPENWGEGKVSVALLFNLF